MYRWSVLPYIAWAAPSEKEALALGRWEHRSQAVKQGLGFQFKLLFQLPARWARGARPESQYHAPDPSLTLTHAAVAAALAAAPALAADDCCVPLLAGRAVVRHGVQYAVQLLLGPGPHHHALSVAYSAGQAGCSDMAFGAVLKHGEAGGCNATHVSAYDAPLPALPAALRPLTGVHPPACASAAPTSPAYFGAASPRLGAFGGCTASSSSNASSAAYFGAASPHCAFGSNANSRFGSNANSRFGGCTDSSSSNASSGQGFGFGGLFGGCGSSAAAPAACTFRGFGFHDCSAAAAASSSCSSFGFGAAAPVTTTSAAVGQPSDTYTFGASATYSNTAPAGALTGTDNGSCGGASGSSGSSECNGDAVDAFSSSTTAPEGGTDSTAAASPDPCSSPAHSRGDDSTCSSPAHSKGDGRAPPPPWATVSGLVVVPEPFQLAKGDGSTRDVAAWAPLFAAHGTEVWVVAEGACTSL